MHRAFLKHRDELIRAVQEALVSSIFENRYTLHPRRLRELATEDVDFFLNYVGQAENIEDDAVKNLGAMRARQGLGERLLLTIGNIFRQYVLEHTPFFRFKSIPALIKVVDQYLTMYLDGYLQQSRDKTLLEQEQLRKALSTALERQRREIYIKNHAIHSSINGIMLTGLDGEITYVNPAFLKMWGYKEPEELEHMKGTPFWNQQDAQKIIHLIQKKSGWQAEFAARGKDNSPLDVMASASLITDASQNPVGIMTSFVEITDRKRLEEQLRKSQKLEAMGNLAGGIAHDFNNLLTVIIGFIDMLMLNLRSEEKLLKFVEGAKKSAEKAASLTQQLLAFSRKQILQPKIINIGELIADTEKMLTRLIRENIQLSTELTPDLGLIRGDPGQIEQVIINLAVNARDAMPEGGELTIRAQNVNLETGMKHYSEIQPGKYVSLVVSDTGDGIDEEIQERIFEPFFTTKKMGKGTGLGLSTVYGIVKQSGGYILVESEAEQGTSFNIYFPRIDQTAEVQAIKAETEEMVPGEGTVLIVEDEEAVRNIASESLRAIGYNTIEASSGEAAIAICRERGLESIDLIITDVVMPQMSGYELANWILAEHDEAKILYMSGYVDDDIIKQAIFEEGRPFLQKPFSPRYLAEKVAEVLRNSS